MLTCDTTSLLKEAIDQLLDEFDKSLDDSLSAFILIITILIGVIVIGSLCIITYRDFTSDAALIGFLSFLIRSITTSVRIVCFKDNVDATVFLFLSRSIFLHQIGEDILFCFHKLSILNDECAVIVVIPCFRNDTRMNIISITIATIRITHDVRQRVETIHQCTSN